MVQEIPTNENTYNAALEPLDPAEVVPANQVPASQVVSNLPDYDTYKVSSLSSLASSIPKVQYTIGKKVLSLDVETTGLNPWEYKLIVCSVWDLDEPKADMKTFAGWDEEALCLEMFDYIASKKPEVVLAFNAKFECRCFITRAMLYHIQAPWIWSVEWHDMMTMLEGGWKNGLSGTMPAGSEENWLKFFFNEVKPYNIEECFAGIREGRLDEMIIRNRTCVQGQGDMYQLFMYCQSEEGIAIAEEKPSSARFDDVSLSGLLAVACEVCGAVNEVKDTNNPGQCWRCYANLPEVTDRNRIREQVRGFDWHLVGLSGDDLKKAKADTKKQSAIPLQPVGAITEIPKTSMSRLITEGSVPHK